jgi:hypothetical protein
LQPELAPPLHRLSYTKREGTGGDFNLAGHSNLPGDGGDCVAPRSSNKVPSRTRRILTGWFMKHCCLRTALPAAVVECRAISFALSHSQLISDEIPEQTHQGKILLNESEARI